MTEDKGILIRNVYYMLAYAFQELKQNNYAEIEGEAFENIYDLFAEILVKGVSCQLKQGLYREYVPMNESMQTIRGKININETIANRIRNNRQISCDFDELSENNVYNQILLTAATVLIRNSDVDEARKSKLKQLMLFFHSVQTIDVHSIHWNVLRFDRNNRKYQMLMYVCYFIISEWLMTTEKGNFKMREFSEDNMNRLFEKFVLAYYIKHHSDYKPNSKYIEWNIDKDVTDTEFLPGMKTDILLTIGERTLIIDTKYYTKVMLERYEKEKLRNSHLYQIYTYVNEYDKEHRHNVDGMLLYAKTKDVMLTDAQILHQDGYNIYIKTLDLNTKFEEITKRLDSFVG